MSEKITDLVPVENTGMAHVSLKKKTIVEIKADEQFRKDLIGLMIKGKHKDAPHYGEVPGVKKMVFQEGIQFIADAFNLGYGEPQITKESENVSYNDMVIEHWVVTVKTPIINLGSGQIIAVGIGSCSTMESKYRYRGEERSCPECGEKAIIKGKAEYGGGWLCYKKKEGCGAKFADDDPEITEQLSGKIENDNPVDVLDTVISMAGKRSRGRVSLRVTGMGRHFRLPEDIEDEGPRHHADSEHNQNGKTQKKPPKEPPKQTGDAPKKESMDEFNQTLMDHFGDADKVSDWLSGTNARTKTVYDIVSYKQMGFFKKSFERDKLEKRI